MRKKIINLQNELLHFHNKILSLKEKKDHHNPNNCLLLLCLNTLFCCDCLMHLCVSVRVWSVANQLARHGIEHVWIHRLQRYID